MHTIYNVVIFFCEEAKGDCKEAGRGSKGDIFFNLSDFPKTLEKQKGRKTAFYIIENASYIKSLRKKLSFK